MKKIFSVLCLTLMMMLSVQAAEASYASSERCELFPPGVDYLNTETINQEVIVFSAPNLVAACVFDGIVEEPLCLVGEIQIVGYDMPAASLLKCERLIRPPLSVNDANSDFIAKFTISTDAKSRHILLRHYRHFHYAKDFTHTC